MLHYEEGVITAATRLENASTPLCLIWPSLFSSGEGERQEGPEGRPGALQLRKQHWPAERLEHHPGRGGRRLLCRLCTSRSVKAL